MTDLSPEQAADLLRFRAFVTDDSHLEMMAATIDSLNEKVELALRKEQDAWRKYRRERSDHDRLKRKVKGRL